MKASEKVPNWDFSIDEVPNLVILSDMSRRPYSKDSARIDFRLEHKDKRVLVQIAQSRSPKVTVGHLMREQAMELIRAHRTNQKSGETQTAA